MLRRFLRYDLLRSSSLRTVFRHDSMFRHLSLNDGILFASLLYSGVDLHLEWASFSTCSQPVHWWLLLSYGCIVAFRAAHLLGVAATGSAPGTFGSTAGADHGVGEFLLDLRQKKTLPRILVAFTWVIALPFFTLWTLLGTKWFWDVLRDSPQCMPTTAHLWFCAFWLLLCYVWIGVHLALCGVAWTLESRVQRAEGDLRAIEVEDIVRRWGPVGGNLEGYRDVTASGAPMPGHGLAPSEIKALPELCLHQDQAGGECSICITELDAGERVRRLPGCGHTFHCSCIDLWLLRRADCPLCKRAVSGHKGGEGVWV